MKARIGRDSLLNLAGQGLPTVVALFSIPFAIEHLGDARFGVLTLAWLIVGTSTLFDLGMGRATTKFVADALGRGERRRIPSILGSAVVVQLLLGTIGGVVVGISAPLIADRVLTIPTSYLAEAQHVLVLAAASIPIALVTGSYRGLMEAARRFDISNSYRIVFTSLTYLSPPVGILLGWGLEGIVAILLGSRVIQLLAMFRTSQALFPDLNLIPRLDRSLLRHMLRFGGWVALTNTIAPLQENMERLVLAALLPIATVTYYSVPKELLDRTFILPGSLTSALFPRIATVASADDAELSRVFALSVKVVTLAMGLLFLPALLAARPLLALWTNDELALLSAPVLQILALGAFASSVNMLAMTLFQGLGRPDITTKQQIIRFPVIGALAWIFISRFGLAGAAWSWTAGRVLALAMNIWAARRLLNWHFRDLHTRLVALSLCAFPVLASILLALDASGLLDSTLPRLAMGVGGAALLLAVYLRFVITHDERSLLFAAIRGAHSQRGEDLSQQMGPR